jgi:hypothetical protein
MLVPVCAPWDVHNVGEKKVPAPRVKSRDAVQFIFEPHLVIFVKTFDAAHTSSFIFRREMLVIPRARRRTQFLSMLKPKQPRD